MCWSLPNSNNDYISYVRGKSNIVQILDTQTDEIFKQKTYQQLEPIKGIAPLG